MYLKLILFACNSPHREKKHTLPNAIQRCFLKVKLENPLFSLEIILIEKMFYEQQKCTFPIYWGHKGNFHSLAFILNSKLPMKLKLQSIRYKSMRQ